MLRTRAIGKTSGRPLQSTRDYCPDRRVLAWVLYLALTSVLTTATGCGSSSALPTTVGARVADGRVGVGVDSGQLEVEPHNERLVVRVLDRARKDVFMAMYILTDRPVIHALERASVQGVRVFVLLEHHPFGMGLQPEQIARQLRATGVFVRWSSPRFALAHAKYMVVDDTTVAVSTANFTRSGFYKDRDFILLSHKRQIVHDISNLFRADWNGKPAAVLDINLIVSPENARSKLEHLLRLARWSIQLYGEEMQDNRIQNILVAAQKRGVRVRVMLPPRVSLTAVQQLRRAHVSVREPSVPYTHAKYVGVDAIRGYIGSENFSTASLDRNRELGILVKGTTLRRLSVRFEKDWSRAARGD